MHKNYGSRRICQGAAYAETNKIMGRSPARLDFNGDA